MASKNRTTNKELMEKFIENENKILKKLNKLDKKLNELEKEGEHHYLLNAVYIGLTISTVPLSISKYCFCSFLVGVRKLRMSLDLCG